jgi:hypothetical protein
MQSVTQELIGWADEIFAMSDRVSPKRWERIVS